MKNFMQQKSTGKCYICGKSTKLNIHKKCGESVDAAKKARVVYESKHGPINQQNSENSRHNSTKKKWASGYIPFFCKD